MSVNVEQEAAEIEETSKNREQTDLSRRTFLSGLAILGVGCAAAMTVGVTQADAAAETTDAVVGAETPVEAEKADDADLEISAQERRARRRGRRAGRRVRRRARRGRRVFRRRARRAGRRARRTGRRAGRRGV